MKYLILLIPLIPLPASAQTLSALTGTGFFVHENGYVITNAHVLDRCKRVQIEQSGEKTNADIIERDSIYDLALLRAHTIPPAIAALRSNQAPLQKGAAVTLIGFPGNGGLTTRAGTFIAPHGPINEPQWLQFTDTASHGNSGGPLLDASGQVIGIVTAKAKTYQYNQNRARNELVAKTDVALQPSLIRAMMVRHNLPIRESNADVNLSPSRIEDRAKAFIVRVVCVQ